MQEEVQRYLLSLDIEAEASENTIAAYRNDLSQLLTFLLRYQTADGQKLANWDQVTAEIAQEYVFQLRERSYASSTVARKVAAVKSFFDYMYTRGIIENDPAALLESPKVKKHIPHTISHDDVERLLAENMKGQVRERLEQQLQQQLPQGLGERLPSGLREGLKGLFR